MKIPIPYLSLALFFILADIICDNYIFRAFNTQSAFYAFFLFLGLSAMQIFASPIQAGISDRRRKQSLIFSLSCSLLALFLLYFFKEKPIVFPSILILILLIKGGLGNTTPLAWSAIADIREKNYRFSFGLSTSSFAIAYLLLSLANKMITENEAVFIVICLFSVLILLGCAIFKNIHHGANPEVGSAKILNVNLFTKEIKLTWRELKNKYTRNGLLAFILWEISLYSVLLLYVDFSVTQFSSTAIAMMSGYITGVIILKFVNKLNDFTLIRLGYYLSTFSLVPFLFLLPFVDQINFIFLAACYFLHTLGNAFLCPTFFSILAKEKKLEDQGITYGLVGSADTIAFLIASIAVRIYNILNINLVYIILLSFFTVAISWIPYKRFENLRLKSIKNDDEVKED